MDEENDGWPEDFLARLGVTRAQMQHQAEIRELFWAEIDKARDRLGTAKPSEVPVILARIARLQDQECFRPPWILRLRRVPMPEEMEDEDATR